MNVYEYVQPLNSFYGQGLEGSFTRDFADVGPCGSKSRQDYHFSIRSKQTMSNQSTSGFKIQNSGLWIPGVGSGQSSK